MEGLAPHRHILRSIKSTLARTDSVTRPTKAATQIEPAAGVPLFKPAIGTAAAVRPHSVVLAHAMVNQSVLVAAAGNHALASHGKRRIGVPNG